MPETSERQILSDLRHTARLSPSVPRTQAAVDRALQRLQNETQRKPSLRRFLVPGSIAAAIALFAGAIWLIGNTRQVSAAELLRQALDATARYKGWVGIITEQDGQLPPARNGVYPGYHLNRANGTKALVQHSKEATFIRIDQPSIGEMTEYDGPSNQIRLGSMIPFSVFLAHQFSMEIPIDLESDLTFFRKQTGREPLSITRRREKDLERIDIRYFAKEAEAKQALEKIADYGTVPFHATLWIDPRSKLFQRVERRDMARRSDGGMTLTTSFGYRYLYGQELNDAYAAGAPRDAKVLDYRLKKEHKQLWERIEKRRELGYGDSLSVLTWSWVEDGKLDNHGVLQLFLRQGRKRYYGEYPVGYRSNVNPEHRNIPSLPGWPEPNIDDALKAAAAADPERVFVSDGQQARGAYPTSGGIHELNENAQFAWHREEGVEIGCRLWPQRYQFGLFDTAGTMQLSHDPQNPAWPLIEAKWFVDENNSNYFSSANKRLSQENFHCFDPAHDDLPIRHMKREYGKDGVSVDSESQQEFSELRQLPGGQWYPARWRASYRTRQDGQLKPNWTMEFRLRIEQNAPIDASWFKMPALAASHPGP